MAQIMPSINVIFRARAAEILPSSTRGVVALIVRDAAAAGAEFPASYRLTNVLQIPSALASLNQAFIKRAFIGYNSAPQAVLLYVLNTSAAISTALDWLATQQFAYLCASPEVTAEEAESVASWIAAKRAEEYAIYKAVLPGYAGDSKAIVNSTGTDLEVGSEIFDAAEYCSRMAGILATTPVTMSATYAPLPEVQDCARMTRAEMDAAVKAGQLITFWDGRQVKLGRAVNSLTTLAGQSPSLQKIKVVEAMDLISSELRYLIEDHWIGRVPNDYNHRVALRVAVYEFFAQLELDGIAEAGSSTVALDAVATRAYLENMGIDTGAMTDAQVLKQSTGTSVFLTAQTTILDAVEDVTIEITDTGAVVSLAAAS